MEDNNLFIEIGLKVADRLLEESAGDPMRQHLLNNLVRELQEGGEVLDSLANSVFATKFLEYFVEECLKLNKE